MDDFGAVGLPPLPPLPPDQHRAFDHARERVEGIPVQCVDGRGRKRLLKASFSVISDHQAEMTEIHMRDEDDPLFLTILKFRDVHTARDEANLARLRRRFAAVPDGNHKDFARFVFGELKRVKRGEEGRHLVLRQLKTVSHLWFTWRREDMFEVPFYPASHKKAREVATEEKRFQRVRVEGWQDLKERQERRIRDLEDQVVALMRERDEARGAEVDALALLRASDGLVGQLQARLDALQERPHGFSVGVQVNLSREILMDVPLGTTQEANMDFSLELPPGLRSDPVGSPEEAESVYMSAYEQIPEDTLDNSGESWASALDLSGGVQRGPSADLPVNHPCHTGSAGDGPGEPLQTPVSVPPARPVCLDAAEERGSERMVEEQPGPSHGGVEDRNRTNGKRRRTDVDEDSAVACEGQGQRKRFRRTR